MTELANRSLVALTPAELPAVQGQLADWCLQKIRSLGTDLREFRENLRQARKMHWRRTGWERAILKTKKQMIYYTKIKSAVQAGYLVVPNFDVDVLAVRVEKQTPPYERDQDVAQCELLAPGTGRYVDDKVKGHKASETYTGSDGKERIRTWFNPTDFNEQLDFPAVLVKPSVLAATNRAMALKLFDRIGIVQTRKSDPIVVGQIIHPNERYRRYNNLRCVTFFIAWFLNTADL